MVSIDFPMFPCVVMVDISKDVQAERRNQAFTFGDPPENLGKATALCSISKDESIIGLFLDVDATPGEVAHECFHAVFHINRFMGASLNKGSNELYAYMLGYLVTQCFDLIKLYRENLPKK
jgi:hypothetical protein